MTIWYDLMLFFLSASWVTWPWAAAAHRETGTGACKTAAFYKRQTRCQKEEEDERAQTQTRHRDDTRMAQSEEGIRWNQINSGTVIDLKLSSLSTAKHDSINPLYF